jgi:acyl carrier protein
MDKTDEEILDKVRRVVAATFRTSAEGMRADTALGVLPGWDSFGHIHLMMEIEKEFAVRFPTEKLNEPKTVGGICELVRQMKSKS